MNAGRAGRMRRWSIAAVLVLVAGIVATREATLRTPSHVPAAEVPRLDLTTGITIPAIGDVADIALAGDQIYVLDGAVPRIVVVDTVSGAVTEFGRRGGGPGEFQNPMSLAVSPDGSTIAVLDGSAVEYFDSTGAFIRNVSLALPCNSPKVHIAWISSGIHVSTSCVEVGSDTIHAIVWRLEDSGSLAELTRTARMSLDGTFGSSFGAQSAIVESGDSLLFGVGTMSCVRGITASGVGERRCGLDGEEFRAPKPSGLDMDRGGLWATLMAWPDPLPAYMDRIVSGDDLYLVRTVSFDSMVARRIHDDAATDVLVAPIETFLRCRGERCFWAVHDTGTTRIVSRVLSTSPRRADAR